MTTTKRDHDARALLGRRDGPAYETIDAALAPLDEYRRFRAGALRRQAYSDWVEAHAAELARRGLDDDLMNLSTRFPIDERAFVAAVLADLHAAGVVAATDYPEAEFERLRARVAERFDHAGLVTYIFPEEARLLFALAHVLRPRRTAFLGSYYGYWAVWAIPGIVAAGGTGVLIDIDAVAMAVAERNLERLGLGGAVETLVADATGPLPPDALGVDLCVLDAEGPEDFAARGMAGKAIYHPIMRRWTPALRPGGLLVAHNMLLRNLVDNAYFSRKVTQNRELYARFEHHLARYYDFRRVYDTSEGVGVYRKRAGADGARAPRT